MVKFLVYLNRHIFVMDKGNIQKLILLFLYHITETRLFKILKILPPKKKRKFSDKNSDIFHIFAQNIDYGYSSNEYPQSIFLSRNKKNNVYPCKPQFYYIKVGLKGVNII